MRTLALLLLAPVLVLFGTVPTHAAWLLHLDPSDPANLYANSTATTPLATPYDGAVAHAVKDPVTGRWIQQGGPTAAPTAALSTTYAPYVLRFNGGQNLLHYDNHGTQTANQGFDYNSLDSNVLNVVVAAKVDQLASGTRNLFGFNGVSPTPADYFGLRYDYAAENLVAYVGSATVSVPVSQDQWFVADVKWNHTNLSLSVNGQTPTTSTITSYDPVNYDRFRLGATASNAAAMFGHVGDLYLATSIEDTSTLTPSLMAKYSTSPISTNQLQLWLRADAVNGTVDGTPYGEVNPLPAAGTPIAQWKDISGNERHASQITTSAQPVFQAASTMHYQPALHFDGTDVLNTAATDFDITGDMTYFIVLNPEKTEQKSVLGSVDTSNRFGIFFTGPTTPNQPARFHFGGGQLQVTHPDGTPYPTDVTTMLAGMREGSAQRAYLDGELIGSNSISSVNVTESIFQIGGMLNGGVPYLEGEIAEVIIYNRALSQAEFDQVSAYLFHKYIPEPSGAMLAILAMLGLLTRKRWRR